jgi:molybdopterin adenylyltransferase
MHEATIGILTVSDRASDGTYEDRSGPAVESWLADVLSSSWSAECRLVPDEQDRIEHAIAELADDAGCCLVITTGGTGPAPRDVTPEATTAACHTMLPGFGERMRIASFDSVPTAILSRQTAGVRGSCLVINLPGKPAAIAECLDAVFAAVPYCIDLIGGARIESRPERLQVFRPVGASPQGKST